MGVTGHRLRVGLLTPHVAAGPEIEIPDMARGRVAVAVARIRPREDAAISSPTGPPTAQALHALAHPGALHDAADRFRDGSVDVLAYASTTTGYVLGARSEAQLVKRLGTDFGVPAVGSAGAAADALRACGTRRIVLVHPPWFDNELDEMGVRYFRDQEFEVTLAKANELPNDPGQVTTRHVIDWVSRHLGDHDDAVFLAGNGFRAARAVEELEQRTDRLVLQANQVLLWSILAATRTTLAIHGYGRLFRTQPSDLACS